MVVDVLVYVVVLNLFVEYLPLVLLSRAAVHGREQA